MLLSVSLALSLLSAFVAVAVAIFAAAFIHWTFYTVSLVLVDSGTLWDVTSLLFSTQMPSMQKYDLISCAKFRICKPRPEMPGIWAENICLWCGFVRVDEHMSDGRCTISKTICDLIFLGRTICGSNVTVEICGKVFCANWISVEKLRIKILGVAQCTPEIELNVSHLNGFLTSHALWYRWQCCGNW